MGYIKSIKEVNKHRIIVANTPQEGQTNISQENNDLPFEIEASALEG